MPAQVLGQLLLCSNFTSLPPLGHKRSHGMRGDTVATFCPHDVLGLAQLVLRCTFVSTPCK